MAGVWAIDGVEVPASVARMLAYVAGGGAEGIVEPGGLKVVPLEVPGTSVRVMPGAAMVANRYPGGSLQAYPIFEQVAQTVAINATGSGGSRTDLVIARVRDTEFADVEPGVVFEVIQGVPTNAGAAYVQALAYPALALARVTLPASTATVTAAMITDLRQLAQPRRDRRLVQGTPAPWERIEAAGGIQWGTYRPAIVIPSWATRMNLVAHLTSVWHQGDAVTGRLMLTVGAGGSKWSIKDEPYEYDAAVGATGERLTISLAIEGTIPTALRGTTQVLGMDGSRLSGSGFLMMAPGTRLIYDVEFTEDAA